MLISKLYNKLNEDQKENLVAGLVVGLVWGLVWGLVVGLVSGLVSGLVVGLVGGLVWGLVVGLVSGLVVILINFSEAFPFLASFYPILILIGLIIFIAELLYWAMPKEKIKKKDLFIHTLKRKAECVFEVLLGFSAITQIYVLTREIQVKQYFPIILKWVGYIGFGLICLIGIILIFYVWIKLNEVKYRR